MSASLTFTAIGDVCLHGVQGDPFVHVSDQLAADIRFCNLECCLTERTSAVDKNVHFSAHPRSADYVAAHGFDLVCLANNHVLDFGPEGLRDTIEALQEKKLRYLGAGRTGEEAVRTVQFESGGVRVAAVAAADASGGAAGGPSVSTLSMKALAGCVARAREGADVVIVSYHGGIELDTLPSPFVVRSLRRLVDAGADIVVGHHPHVLQPVEMYKGRVIAYSLGNFVFDNERYGDKAALAARSMILKVRLGFSGGRLRTVETENIPVVIARDGVPRPVEAGGREEFENYMRGLENSLQAIDTAGPDVQRMENYAREFHTKSLATIVRYGVRHFRDFSLSELWHGMRIVLRNAWARRFRKTR